MPRNGTGFSRDILTELDFRKSYSKPIIVKLAFFTRADFIVHGHRIADRNYPSRRPPS
jgi:hypothetical protein